MSVVKDGGPAFPPPGTPHPKDPCKVAIGLSLRDWFASNATDGDISSITEAWFDKSKNEWVDRSRSERRYIFADAMLAAREAKQ